MYYEYTKEEKPWFVDEYKWLHGMSIQGWIFVCVTLGYILASAAKNKKMYYEYTKEEKPWFVDEYKWLHEMSIQGWILVCVTLHSISNVKEYYFSRVVDK